MAMTNNEKQRAFYARGKDIPRTVSKYQAPLHYAYLRGFAAAQDGLKPASEQEFAAEGFPDVSHVKPR